MRFRKLDGSEHECSGEFPEIEEPRRIVMSYQWTAGGLPQERGRVSRLELHLRSIDTGTELTLVHAALADEPSPGLEGPSRKTQGVARRVRWTQLRAVLLFALTAAAVLGNAAAHRLFPDGITSSDNPPRDSVIAKDVISLQQEKRLQEPDSR